MPARRCWRRRRKPRRCSTSSDGAWQPHTATVQHGQQRMGLPATAAEDLAQYQRGASEALLGTQAEAEALLNKQCRRLAETGITVHGQSAACVSALSVGISCSWRWPLDAVAIAQCQQCASGALLETSQTNCMSLDIPHHVSVEKSERAVAVAERYSNSDRDAGAYCMACVCQVSRPAIESVPICRHRSCFTVAAAVSGDDPHCGTTISALCRRSIQRCSSLCCTGRR